MNNKKISMIYLLLLMLLFSTQIVRAEDKEIFYEGAIPYYYEVTSEGEEVVTYVYNAKNALKILRSLAKMETGYFNREFDVNADGSITLDDAELALKSAAKLVKVQFPLDRFIPE